MQEEINRASEIARDPFSVLNLTYVWVFFLAAWGGVVRVIREHKLEAKTWGQIIWIFVSEVIVSCFVGVITFYSCQLAGFEPLYTALLTSIGGYMGGRSLNMIESIYRNAFGKGDHK